MKTPRNRGIAIVLVSTLMLVAAAARADEPVNWDLSEIYADDAAWAAALKKLVDGLGDMDRFKGRLGSSAATLREALDVQFAMTMKTERLGSYAGMRADEDLRESGPQGMRQELRNVTADVQTATAWVEPELLTIPGETLTAFMEEEPGLAIYRRYLERLEKRRPHVLDPDTERLLGMAARMRGSGMTVGGLLRDAEIPWPTITLSDGSELRLDAAGYSIGRASADRDDRVASYEGFYNELQGFKGSLAATLNATVQEHVFDARVRHYESSLDASLTENEVDTDVYRMLVEEINASLPTLHRYLKLRARILGIDALRYHDMYPSLVGAVTADYTWDNSKKLTAEALVPLGDEYVRRFLEGMIKGWVDVYPRTGKRSGAYVNDAAYEVHPYMLLNHSDDYRGATTLAHEAGHLMQSWYSQEAQPYPTSSYSIFVAEVASTVNEVLFVKHLVARATDDEERLGLLGNFLEGLRTTIFRQAMFAEFELAVHEMAERGDPLTGDGLNELYLDLLRRYHGEAKNVTKIDELYSVEWAFVPHFHYNFYVYQYATSYVAAIALAEGIQEDRRGARKRYMEFLAAGSTKPPVELLQDAGVDMTSPAPIRAAMRLMNDVLDQIDAILEKRE